MEIILIIILLLVLLALSILIWLNIKGKKPEVKKDDTGLNLILQQINELNRTVDSKISETTKSMNDSVKNQFGESQRLVGQFLKEITNMTEKVTRVEETGKQMVSFADQLQSLQDILKNPKQRGILGEYYLETLLKNAMSPDQYQMQYKFKDGEIVDAIIKVKDKLIPVDSKFSLENYNRIIETKDEVEKNRLGKLFENDLKNRIVETSKYIRPSEKTMDFAFMFIPHEAIYYDLLTNKVGVSDDINLIQRAVSKYKVIIVSPTSFLAYLQTVLQGLKAMQIEESAKDIVKRVGELTVHLKKYAEKYDKLGKSLSTVVNQYMDGGKEFKKIDKDIVRITEGEKALGYEPLELDKPETEE